MTFSSAVVRSCLIGLLMGTADGQAADGGGARAADPAAIAEVTAGRRTEALAAWWGFDPAEATAALQGAIDSGAKRVVVENLGAPWVVDKIRLASDQEVVFRPGVEVVAKRGAFKGKGDALFTARLARNLALIGPGATFRMWKQDYVGAGYDKAEWRHALSLLSCTNVRVEGLTLRESGGDGIYLGVAQGGIPCRDVQIRDVTCDANHRQGISVICAENLLIENCVLRNTAGTPPQAGIDFEPNLANERIVNCVMRNCLSENNNGDNYVFYLKPLTGKSEPVSVRFENCRSRGGHSSGLRWVTQADSPDGPTRGQAEFVDCVFEGSEGAGVVVAENAAAACRVRLANCQVLDAAVSKPETTPVVLASGPGSEPVGGVEFADCVVRDSLERQPLSYSDGSGAAPLTAVTGTIVLERGGQRTPYPLTAARLAEWVPALGFRRFEPVRLDGRRWRLAAGGGAATAPAGGAAPTVCVRERHEFLLWGEAGRELRFTVRVEAVGTQAGVPCGLRLVAPSGQEAKLSAAPPAAETPYVQAAAETGAYRLVVEPGNGTVRVRPAAAGLSLLAGPRPAHLFGWTGELVFQVPAGTAAFAVKVVGSNPAERVKAELVDPSGKVVQAEDSIARPVQLLVERPAAAAGEVWHLRLNRPTVAILEDYYVEVQGIPPVLAASPADLLVPEE